MTPCFLSLGSNSGDRLRRLRSALAGLRRLPKTRLGRVSSIYETTPVGAGGQRDFLNLTAEIRTDLSPMGLLLHLKALEAGAGRRPGLRWGPRPLDIDILTYGRRGIKTRFLDIPHPRALKRRFVLVPLAELDPRAKAPLSSLKEPGQHVKIYKSYRRK